MSAKVFDFKVERAKRMKDSNVLTFPESSRVFEEFQKMLIKDGIKIQEEKNNYSEEEMEEIKKGNFFRPMGVIID